MSAPRPIALARPLARTGHGARQNPRAHAHTHARVRGAPRVQIQGARLAQQGGGIEKRKKKEEKKGTQLRAKRTLRRGLTGA